MQKTTLASAKLNTEPMDRPGRYRLAPAEASIERVTEGKAQLYAGAAGRIDILRCSGRRRDPGSGWHAKHGHFVMPLAGAFVWHFGRLQVLCDANQLLFAPAGSESAFAHPHGPEFSFVVTPGRGVIHDIVGKENNWSQATCRAAGPALQLAAHSLRHALIHDDDPISIDERVIGLIQMMLDADEVSTLKDGSARRTLERAKAFLHARFAEAMTLTEIATAVGVTPVYLTALFRRVEGIALHQYLLKLRLAAGLERLPGCSDITGLALDLGFSSHSHFSATFRKRFGTTPNSYRRRCAVPASTARIRPADVSLQPLCAARGGGA